MPDNTAGRGNEPAAELTIFTICASNYLAHASVLGASIREHHPGLALVVFLLDTPPQGAALPEHLVIRPAQQVMGHREWNHRRAHYDILEFATSVKPACFRFLFDEGAKRAIYLDPDIRLFGPVDPFWRSGASDAALVLTPHILTPLPDDGRRPDDLMILRAGIYNLGFAAMRDTPQARSLLEWWDARLHTLCLQDFREGVFTDQRWMDLAPLLLRDCMILDRPGFNVAYWNLHERIPRQEDGQWRVDGPAGPDDLVFFHFSGFAPGRPGISRHEDRIGSQPPGDAPRLFEAYARALAEAGLRSWAALPAPRAAFRDGTGWDAACRALYRQAVAEGVDLGDPLENPGFLNWAAGTAPGDHVPRYLRAVLRLRSDVAAAYDDGRDADGLRSWLRDSGALEMGLEATLIERFAGGAASPASAVTFVGYLRSHLGVGEAARQSVAALEAAGIQVHAHDISDQASSPMGAYVLPAARPGAGAPAITILGCNADALPRILPTLPQDLLNAYRIGCWYWETPDFPEQWSDRYDKVDEVWAATRFVAEAIRAKATVPVVVMPPMVRPPRARRDRAWLSRLLPEVRDGEFVFLFQFDVASVPFRKNPEGTIAAFSRAFVPEEPVRLVVKLLNGDAEPGLLDDLRAMAAGRRITLFDGVLESDERYRLLASVDGFVSLHRSEGFGLSIAEAMAYGLPVVATDWSGNVDFTTPDNAAVVPCDIVPAARAHGPYPAGTPWAEPRLDVAAQLMRRVWTDKAWRESIGAAGAATIERLYSAPAVGGAMRARLQRIERSARFRARQPAAAATHRRGTAPTEGAGPARSRAALIASDALRYPGYYIARLPRLPGLLWRLGVSDMLEHAEVVATGAPEIKRRYRVATIVLRLRQSLTGRRAAPGQQRAS